MTTPRDYLHYWVPALVCLGCCLIAAISLDISRNDNFLRGILIGLLFGTMFAQTTVASVWTVTGPMRFILRGPFALLWIAMLIIAFALNNLIFANMRPGPNSEVIFIIGLCLLGQWIVTQVPVWICTFGFGLKLRRPEVNEPAEAIKERQFTIQQLIIVTTVIAVILGMGRVLVSVIMTDLQSSGGRGELPTFIAVTVVAILISLPLMLAAMLRRYTVIATLLMLLLIAIATPWEVSLMSIVENRRISDPNVLYIFSCINTVTAMWILLFACAVRMNGYQLVLSAARVEQSKTIAKSETPI